MGSNQLKAAIMNELKFIIYPSKQHILSINNKPKKLILTSVKGNIVFFWSISAPYSPLQKSIIL